MTKKVDPISDEYYVPLERAEGWLKWLFYVTALMSIVILFIDANSYPNVHETMKIAFIVLAVASFILGSTIKHYWAPRGTKSRLSDFLSTAFDVNLSPERTEGYYNNKETDPIRRVAMQVLENSYHTKNAALLLCVRRRAVVATYVVLWLVVVSYRSFPLDLLIIASQVLLGEEIVSSVVRSEWLRGKTEEIFNSMYRNLESASAVTKQFTATVIESLTCYEIIKATAGVTLSSDIFADNRARWSSEWDAIRSKLEK